MGLDALGDAYWLSKRGNKLENAVASGEKEDIETIITYELDSEIFSAIADRILLRAMDGDPKIVALLLNKYTFAGSLSYRGLLMANEKAKEKKSAELSSLVSAKLEEKTEAIRKLEGAEEDAIAMGYLKYLKTRTVSNANGDEVMLTGSDDALMYAVENREMPSLIRLANSDMHRELDEKELDFMRSRVEKLPAYPLQLKEVAIFVLDVMEREGKRDEILERATERGNELAKLTNALAKLSRPTNAPKEKARST